MGLIKITNVARDVHMYMYVMYAPGGKNLI